MKIMVTGVNGQLGYDVVKELNKQHYEEVIGVDIDDLNITNEEAVKRFMYEEKPKIIIHCAAYTAVDNAEENIDLCMDVNVNGTKYLVNSAKQNHAKFVYISTDYVFDGENDTKYKITDNPNPKTVYGISKLGGELETLKHDKSFIIRTSWVFGKNGNNFVKTMLKLGKERESISIVSDQFGSPTYTSDLSKLIANLIKTENYGVYHVSNEGFCSWYEFAEEIFKLKKYSVTTKPIKSSSFAARAKRPKNSMMDKSQLEKIGFNRLPHWKNALKRYLIEIGEI